MGKPKKKTNAANKSTSTKFASNKKANTVQKGRVAKKCNKKRKNVSNTKKKQKMVAPGTAKFRANSKNDKGYLSFDKILQAGWVNDPLILGRLRRIKHTAKSVIFEFQLNNIKFDAWSGKDSGWAEKNLKKLRENYSYVLKGTMLAKNTEEKYSTSSNSKYKFEVNLSNIEIVEEIQNPIDIENNPATNHLKEINQLIKSQETFTKHAENLKIVSGDVRRYMGCEVCYAGIPKLDSNGKYSCEICIKTKATKGRRVRNRRVCIVIRNLKLRDEQGNVLENAICYQRQCDVLFETHVDRLCSSSTDLDARDEFANRIGTIISANIKHQKVLGRKQRAFGNFKLIVEDLKIEKGIRKQHKSLQTEAAIKPWLVSSKIVPNIVCPCKQDEDDDENEDENDSSVITPSTSQNSLRNDMFILDSGGQYELVPTNPGGYIGLAIIINMNFHPSEKNVGRPKHRRGSEKDVERLEDLFPKIGVRIFRDQALQDLNKKQFDSTVKEFKEELINGKYSSMFFVLMSHGTLYTVRLDDMNKLNIYRDILPLFGEREFEEFSDKPKVFIFNACQYFEDSGNVAVDDTQRKPNFLECYPCDPGVRAKRNVMKGSYFIQALADVWGNEEYRNTMHIEEMMKQVQNIMDKKRLGNDKKSINVPIYKPVLFGLKFYFSSPGLSTIRY